MTLLDYKNKLQTKPEDLRPRCQIYILGWWLQLSQFTQPQGCWAVPPNKKLGSCGDRRADAADHRVWDKSHSEGNWLGEVPPSGKTSPKKFRLRYQRVRTHRLNWAGVFSRCRRGRQRCRGCGRQEAAPLAPAWIAGCTAGRPGRSCGWHPGPCPRGSWSPLGCWKCSSSAHSDLRRKRDKRRLVIKRRLEKQRQEWDQETQKIQRFKNVFLFEKKKKKRVKSGRMDLLCFTEEKRKNDGGEKNQ